METKYRIGYIDEDVKQVKKFARNLRPFGFEVIGYQFETGMSPEALMDQVYMSNIDLLMIDYKLKEANVVSFNGDIIEGLLYNAKPLFPHIIFTSDINQAEAHVEDLKIIFDKRDVLIDDDKPTKEQERFVKMLIRSIEQYKQYIMTRKQELGSILEKGEKDGLNAAEKSRLIGLQEELNILNRTTVDEIPRQLISFDKLDDLAKSRKEAEIFLQSLIEKTDEKSKG